MSKLSQMVSPDADLAGQRNFFDAVKSNACLRLALKISAMRAALAEAEGARGVLAEHAARGVVGKVALCESLAAEVSALSGIVSEAQVANAACDKFIADARSRFTHLTTAGKCVHAPVCVGMEEARTSAHSWQSNRDLRGRSGDPVQARQGRRGLTATARNHGQAEADGQRGEDTNLQGSGRGIRLPGLHVWADVLSNDWPGPYGHASVEEEYWRMVEKVHALPEVERAWSPDEMEVSVRRSPTLANGIRVPSSHAVTQRQGNRIASWQSIRACPAHRYPQL
ncbi:hypothetical protein OKW35_004578 [Paraburkholderia sp. MM5477-R1]